MTKNEINKINLILNWFLENKWNWKTLNINWYDLLMDENNKLFIKTVQQNNEIIYLWFNDSFGYLLKMFSSISDEKLNELLLNKTLNDSIEKKDRNIS